MVSVASSVPLLHEMPARLQLDSLRSWPLRDGRTYYKLLDQTRSDGAYSLTYKPDPGRTAQGECLSTQVSVVVCHRLLRSYSVYLSK